MDDLGMELTDLGWDEVIMRGVKLEGDDVMGEVVEGEKRFVELVKRFETDVIFGVSLCLFSF
jgi:hypothetical protein